MMRKETNVSILRNGLIENFGAKRWYRNGKLHRLDGPAIDYFYGNKEWYYQGNHIKCGSREEFEKLIRLKIFW